MWPSQSPTHHRPDHCNHYVQDLARLQRQMSGLELTVSTFQQDVVAAIDADLEASRERAHQIVSTELADTRQAMRRDCEDIFEDLYKDAQVGVGEMINEKIDRAAQLMQQGKPPVLAPPLSGAPANAPSSLTDVF